MARQKKWSNGKNPLSVGRADFNLPLYLRNWECTIHFMRVPFGDGQNFKAIDHFHADFSVRHCLKLEWQ